MGELNLPIYMITDSDMSLMNEPGDDELINLGIGLVMRPTKSPGKPTKIRVGMIAMMI